MSFARALHKCYQCKHLRNASEDELGENGSLYFDSITFWEPRLDALPARFCDAIA